MFSLCLCVMCRSSVTRMHNERNVYKTSKETISEDFEFTLHVLPVLLVFFFFFLIAVPPFYCLVFNRIALSVCELNLMVRRSNIENWQYLLALKKKKKISVILFPGIKCHDISSFTCLTCALVFFVSILGSLPHLSCRVSPLSLSLSLSVKHSRPLISVCSPRMSTVSVCVST